MKKAESKRIHKLLVRKAKQYVAQNNLYKDATWQQILEQFYTQNKMSFDEIVQNDTENDKKTLTKFEQQTVERFSLAVDPVVQDELFN